MKNLQLIILAALVGFADVAPAGPVRLIPGLVSIIFYERTGRTNVFTFAAGDVRLLKRRADPFALAKSDFIDAAYEEF